MSSLSLSLSLSLSSSLSSSWLSRVFVLLLTVSSSIAVASAASATSAAAAAAVTSSNNNNDANVKYRLIENPNTGNIQAEIRNENNLFQAFIPCEPVEESVQDGPTTTVNFSFLKCKDVQLGYDLHIEATKSQNHVDGQSDWMYEDETGNMRQVKMSSSTSSTTAAASSSSSNTGNGSSSGSSSYTLYQDPDDESIIFAELTNGDDNNDFVLVVLPCQIGNEKVTSGEGFSKDYFVCQDDNDNDDSYNMRINAEKELDPDSDDWAFIWLYEDENGTMQPIQPKKLQPQQQQQPPPPANHPQQPQPSADSSDQSTNVDNEEQQPEPGSYQLIQSQEGVIYAVLWNTDEEKAKINCKLENEIIANGATHENESFFVCKDEDVGFRLQVKAEKKAPAAAAADSTTITTTTQWMYEDFQGNMQPVLVLSEPSNDSTDDSGVDTTGKITTGGTTTTTEEGQQQQQVPPHLSSYQLMQDENGSITAEITTDHGVLDIPCDIYSHVGAAAAASSSSSSNGNSSQNLNTAFFVCQDPTGGNYDLQINAVQSPSSTEYGIGSSSVWTYEDINGIMQRVQTISQVKYVEQMQEETGENNEAFFNQWIAHQQQDGTEENENKIMGSGGASSSTTTTEPTHYQILENPDGSFTAILTNERGEYQSNIPCDLFNEIVSDDTGYLHDSFFVCKDEYAGHNYKINAQKSIDDQEVGESQWTYMDDNGDMQRVGTSNWTMMNQGEGSTSSSSRANGSDSKDDENKTTPQDNASSSSSSSSSQDDNSSSSRADTTVFYQVLETPNGDMYANVADDAGEFNILIPCVQNKQVVSGQHKTNLLCVDEELGYNLRIETRESLLDKENESDSDWMYEDAMGFAQRVRMQQMQNMNNYNNDVEPSPQKGINSTLLGLILLCILIGCVTGFTYCFPARPYDDDENGMDDIKQEVDQLTPPFDSAYEQHFHDKSPTNESGETFVGSDEDDFPTFNECVRLDEEQDFPTFEESVQHQNDDFPSFEESVQQQNDYPAYEVKRYIDEDADYPDSSKTLYLV